MSKCEVQMLRCLVAPHDGNVGGGSPRRPDLEAARSPERSVTSRGRASSPGGSPLPPSPGARGPPGGERPELMLLEDRHSGAWPGGGKRSTPLKGA